MRQFTLRRIAPLQAAKMAGAIYAVMGSVIGALVSLAVVFGAFARSAAGVPGPQPARMLFGVGAIVILPMFYGLLGFLMTLPLTALYNLLAGWLGGIRVEAEMTPSENEARPN